MTRKKMVTVLLLLAGCGLPPPMRCTGSRPMQCDCVLACETTPDEVLVKEPPECAGLALCTALKDGGS